MRTLKEPAKYIDVLKKINAGNLLSVFLYAENRLLVLLKEINSNNLLANSAFARKLQRQKIVPLFLTKEYIRTSCDVYPLEYLKMKKDYKLLFGSDVLMELDIPAGNIRLESEQKIKGALIRLTQVILEAGVSRKRLARVIFFALEAVLEGIEGVLHIAGRPDVAGAAALISCAEQVFGLKLGPLETAYGWQNGRKPENVEVFLHEFYEKIEELAGFVDRMEPV